MKLKLKITRYTTDSELIHLGNFFTALGINRGGKVFAAPTDPAELVEPETIEAGDDPTPAETVLVPEAPKRRRRTKAEIEAEIAEREAANKPAVTDNTDVHAGSAIPSHEGEAGNVPASTQSAPPPDTPPSETASTAPASASPSDGKTYTHAEVQAMAVDAARRYGPEKVKAIIATYPNAAKIAELAEADLAGFVGKLQTLTA